MTMITPSYLGETIEYSSLHACRSTLEDPTSQLLRNPDDDRSKAFFAPEMKGKITDKFALLFRKPR